MFYSRWNILAGDHGKAQYKVNAGAWTDLTGADFSGCQNVAYPGWTKYTFTLPSTGGSSATYRVRLIFTSNSSGTAWGYGVDSVSVYQADLAAPVPSAPQPGSRSSARPACR